VQILGRITLIFKPQVVVLAYLMVAQSNGVALLVHGGQSMGASWLQAGAKLAVGSSQHIFGSHANGILIIWVTIREFGHISVSSALLKSQ
jgi:hypothetical protein